MTARVGTKERLAEVRTEDVRRRRQWTPAQRAAWRMLDRDSATHAAELVLDGYAGRLRTLDADQLEHEANRVDALPTSPATTEMRHEIEIEQAGRRWRTIVRIAAVIGWEEVIAMMRLGLVGVQ